MRKHHTLKTTPAVAAGIEEKPWSLEQVVDMTEAYWLPKIAEAKAIKAMEQRIADDARFDRAFKRAGM